MQINLKTIFWFFVVVAVFIFIVDNFNSDSDSDSNINIDKNKVELENKTKNEKKDLKNNLKDREKNKKDGIIKESDKKNKREETQGGDIKEFNVEISRAMISCFPNSPRQCLQVRKEGEEWKIFYDEISDFDYVIGDYYVIRVEEKKRNSNNKDLSDKVWKLKKVIKHYPKENKVAEKKDEKTIVKVPTWKYDDAKNKFITTFKKYEVPKTKAVLRATLKKLFELRSRSGEETWNGLKFASVAIRGDVAEIRLKGEWYPDGDMSGAYFRTEIEEASFQFSTVKNVRVFVDDKIFDWCIDSNADPEDDGCDRTKKLWDTTIR